MTAGSIILEGFLSVIYIFLFSHLTVDKDIPPTMKIVSWIVFIGIAVVYFLCKVVF